MSFVLILIGLVLVAFGVKGVLKESNNHRFQPVNVLITDSGIVERKVSQLYVQVSYYDIRLSFSYSVNGSEYSVENIILNEDINDEYKARQRLTEVLDKSTVHYDPENPEVVALKLSNTGDLAQKFGGIIGAGLLLIVAAIAVLAVG